MKGGWLLAADEEQKERPRWLCNALFVKMFLPQLSLSKPSAIVGGLCDDAMFSCSHYASLWTHSLAIMAVVFPSLKLEEIPRYGTANRSREGGREVEWSQNKGLSHTLPFPFNDIRLFKRDPFLSCPWVSKCIHNIRSAWLRSCFSMFYFIEKSGNNYNNYNLLLQLSNSYHSNPFNHGKGDGTAICQLN